MPIVDVDLLFSEKENHKIWIGQGKYPRFYGVKLWKQVVF